ncbi:MAG: hypothetical protein JSS22_04435, partial [Proteobacteria bacterium]|nr:hypothetical protein [Pseudomonadota bacterium]
LDQSAAALTAAAARLAAGGTVTKATTAATSAAVAGGATAFGGFALPATIAGSLAVPAIAAYLAWQQNKANPTAKPSEIVGGDGDMAWAANFGAAFDKPSPHGPFTLHPFPGGTAATYGTAEPAKAEVVGNATLDINVQVSPSADFMAKVDQRVDNKINAFRASGAAASGSTGSTGRSMPEAVAAP